MSGSKTLDGILTSSSTRQSLLDGINRNDNDAWTRFMDAYGANLKSWILRILKGRLKSDADDIVNDVCLRVFQEWPGVKYDSARTFKGWVVQTAKWKVADVVAAHLRMPANFSAIREDFDPEQVIAADSESWYFDPMYEQLMLRAEADIRPTVSAAEWECYERVVHLHETVLEVETKTGIPNSTVSDRKRRVFKRVSARAQQLETQE